MSRRRPHYIGTCTTCGKRCYVTKRAAKTAARALHPGDHLNAYRCGPWWHLGHLPRQVVTGDLARPDIRRTTP